LTQLPDSYDIEFRDVWFRYPGTGKDVLKGLSFKIPSGQKVSIVGENGAGKTTFVKLLTRMLEPSSGEIRINGKSTRDTDAADHYNSTASVFQEPARFHTFTIADNVFLGDVEKERDEQAIDRALRFAGFDGADKHALLGKEIGGTELSGGQWQKLAIARAYYRDRDLIILDEPTSNLDPLAETEIFKKYLDMSEGKNRHHGDAQDKRRIARGQNRRVQGRRDRGRRNARGVDVPQRRIRAAVLDAGGMV